MQSLRLPIRTGGIVSAVECRNCSREVQDGADLCTTCADGLAQRLREVPDLLEQLHVSYAKQDRLGSSNGHRGKLSESPMPVRFDVRRVIDALGNEVTTWGRDLVETHGFEVPPLVRRSAHNGERGVVFPAGSPTVDAYCYAATWLAEHVGHLRRHPAAMEAHTQLTDAIEAAETAMERPEPQLFVGYCANPRSFGECGASLYAPRGAARSRCERCGTTITDLADRWGRALLVLRGYPATAADLASWVSDLYRIPVDRKRVNDWHYRGTLRKVDDDPVTGDPRFRIGEVLDRAAKSKPRKAG